MQKKFFFHTMMFDLGFNVANFKIRKLRIFSFCSIIRSVPKWL